MAKVVVPRNTQLIAFVSVVVLVAAHPDAVLEASYWPIVHDGLPVVTRVDHPRVNDALDQKLLPICNKHRKVKVKGSSPNVFTDYHYHFLAKHPENE